MIKELYKEKNFQGVINLHNRLNNTDNYNEWDYFYVANSFYKLKDYRNAFQLGKKCLSNFKDFNQINNVMGWSLYQAVLKDFNDEINNVHNITKYVDYITSNCAQEKYSPYEKSVKKIINIIYSKSNHQIDYKLGNKYLDFLNPDLLSNEKNVFNINGKYIEVPSDREKWYLKKTKTLYELKMYNKCLEVINDALPKSKTFIMEIFSAKLGKNVERWLIYRQACCYMQLNDYREASKILLELSKSFTHWCVYEKLYEIKKNEGDFEGALKNASIAVLTDGEHKLRVSMLESVGDYLKDNGYIKEAQYHYNLAYLIRKEEGWKNNKKLEEMITDKTIRISNKKNTLKYLNNFWKSYKYAGVTFKRGVICKIFDGAKSGFIEGDDGNKYYFIINGFINRPKNINIEEKVKFIPIEGFDKKKNRKSLQATDIEFIKI